jgi:hypothetical protein
VSPEFLGYQQSKDTLPGAKSVTIMIAEELSRDNVRAKTLKGSLSAVAESCFPMPKFVYTALRLLVFWRRMICVNIRGTCRCKVFYF